MFSYVLFAPLVLLLIFFLFFLITLAIIEAFFVPPLVLYGLQQYPDQLSLFFVHNGVPDQQALALWIKHPGGYYPGYQPVFRAIVDHQGRVIVSSGRKPISPDQLLQTQLSTQAAANLQQVLAGKDNNQGMVSKDADGAIIAIVSIRGEDHAVDGALIDDTGADIYGQEALFWLGYDSLYIFISVGVYTVFAALIGLAGGFFVARTITRRFNRLAAVADKWSLGNFSSFVQDTSPDELGQLSRKLNRMAEQLQHLLQTRRQFAILEERNRLARDLHDSVKQHIFVLALQVETAKLRLEQGPDVAEAQHRLAEAEGVLHQVQEELKTLIRELRPVALEGKGLRPALQELVAQWERQNGIAVSLQINGANMLSPQIEEAIFRVAQEALSNVARHSQASTVEVQLVNQPERVTLSIADNGQGLESGATEVKGVGLLSMRERMQALGGDIEITSQSGNGLRLVAYCPGEFCESGKGEQRRSAASNDC